MKIARVVVVVALLILAVVGLGIWAVKSDGGDRKMTGAWFAYIFGGGLILYIAKEMIMCARDPHRWGRGRRMP